MPDNPRRAKGGGWAVLALGLVLLPMLYVLSVGPTAWVFERIDTDSAWAAWATFYAPLFWVYDSVPLGRPVLRWYLHLCTENSIDPAL
jgi:hypothetical protein